MLASLLLGERAELPGGLVVERTSLLGYSVAGYRGLSIEEAKRVLQKPNVCLNCTEVTALEQCACGGEVGERPLMGGRALGAAKRTREVLSPGPAARARIEELRLLHGSRAVRVTGQAHLKRVRWTKAEAKLVVSYPAERSGGR